ncbi:MAG: hypothetical protein ABI197_02680 [Granulicella sp.]
MFPVIVLSLGSVLYLAAVVILALGYLRTRDKGLLWLGVAILIWPYLSSLLERGESVLALRASGGHWAGFFPFSLVSQGQTSVGRLYTSLHSLHHLIGAGLLLVVVLYLVTGKYGRLQTIA